ncbi:MAG: hypothetical protein WDW36_005406 [Sanguina aurantia]
MVTELLRGSSAQQQKPAPLQPTLWTQLQLPTFKPPTQHMLPLSPRRQEQQQQQQQLPPSTISPSISDVSSRSTRDSKQSLGSGSVALSYVSEGGDGHRQQGDNMGSSNPRTSTPAQTEDIWRGATASLHTPMHALRQWELQPGSWALPCAQAQPPPGQRGYGQAASTGDEGFAAAVVAAALSTTPQQSRTARSSTTSCGGESPHSLPAVSPHPEPPASPHVMDSTRVGRSGGVEQADASSADSSTWQAGPSARAGFDRGERAA